MLRSTICALTAVLLGAATPAFAGTVYIPLVANIDDVVPFETEVLITIDGLVDAQFKPLFIPTDTDGTVRGEDPQSLLLLAGNSTRLTYTPTDLGFLEIDGDSQLVYEARLIGDLGSIDSVGTTVPVVSSENVIPRGETAHVQGWVREGSLTTDFGILNIGHQDATCTVSVVDDDGTTLLLNFTAPWKPLSQRQYPDALALIGQDLVVGARAIVTCDQPFYPYAVVLDSETGEARFIRPSEPGTSTLRPPSDDPGGGCPFEAVCLSLPGLQHTATSFGTNLREISIPIEPGREFRRIEVEMDVFVAARSNFLPNGQHMFFWIWRNRFRENTFGRFSWKAGRYQLFNNVDLPGTAQNAWQGGTPNFGTTYHLSFVYDAENDVKQAILTTQGGQQVANIRITTPINRIFSEETGFILRLGANVVDNVANNPGWKWSNVEARFIP